MRVDKRMRKWTVLAAAVAAVAVLSVYCAQKPTSDSHELRRRQGLCRPGNL